VKRIITILLSVLALTGGAAASVQLAGVAHALAPAVEVCDNNGSSSLCMNTKGGVVALNTPIIGWSAGDSNNGYEFLMLNEMCGAGVVTSTCPQLPGTMNARFIGQPLISIENLANHGYCYGTDTNSAAGLLTLCPTPNGTQGGWGVVLIAPGWLTQPHPWNLVSVHWSQHDGINSYLCTIGKGFGIYSDYHTITAHTCYWNEIFN